MALTLNLEVHQMMIFCLRHHIIYDGPKMLRFLMTNEMLNLKKTYTPLQQQVPVHSP